MDLDHIIDEFGKNAVAAKTRIEKLGRLVEYSVRDLGYQVLGIVVYAYLMFVLALLIAPILLRAPDQLLVDIGSIPYLIAAFSFLCHQMPERSFMIFGIPFPVCARCIGIYLGSFTGIVAAIFSERARRRLESLKLFLLAFIPIGFDGLGQAALGFPESPNLLRFTTGIIFGLIVSAYVVIKVGNRFPLFSEKVSGRTGVLISIIGALAYYSFVLHAISSSGGIGYVGAMEAVDISSNVQVGEGTPIVYYITPRGPLSVRADRFAGVYDDYVIQDLLNMSWADDEYENKFGVGNTINGKPLTERHLMGIWVVGFHLDSRFRKCEKYAYTCKPGTYVYVDAYTREILEVVKHDYIDEKNMFN